MKRIIIFLAISFARDTNISAQQFYFPKSNIADSSALVKEMPVLAGNVIAVYKNKNPEAYLNILFKLQIVAGEYEAAIASISSFRKFNKSVNSPFPHLDAIQFEMYANSAKTSKFGSSSFNQLFHELHNNLSDKEALYISTAFISRFGVEDLLMKLNQSLSLNVGKDSINIDDAITVCVNYCFYKIYRDIEPLTKLLLAEEDARRYIVQDSILIKTKSGATISAIVIRKRNVINLQPTVLCFTIYAEPNNVYQAKTGAAYGYASVVALTRGKGFSPDEIVPYEDEVEDVNEVIEWIIRQPWSNGKVGMYGGSYNGFSQWAATKHLHPALKTIVPYVAAIPGLGLPMENNVFITANYGWAFYVSDNKYLDDKIYYDPQRWSALQREWYKSGVAYRKIDSIDGVPNKWLQRWLKHPDYDKYWQSMVPYKWEYAKINIPVLTITGYYDDGQISALHYLNEHYKYNKRAEHYLIIGPYDHFGAQRGGVSVLRDYTVDPVALINTREITFEWLDYILKGGKKPAILKDRINYEVMGANTWKYAASVKGMSNSFLNFYLTDSKAGNYYQLSSKKPGIPGFLNQVVDFSDRQTTNNNYYPYPIILDSLDHINGLFFISEPFNEPVTINGCFLGNLKASINKKDMDIGVVLYELMPDGRYFHLSYFLGRASYAGDMSKRKLLTPDKTTSIPFDRTRMVCRRLSQGSRLVVVLNINKNPFGQINDGTGKEVSAETILEAKEPLRIKWANDSFIKIPVWK